jgi:hypothetical protein
MKKRCFSGCDHGSCDDNAICERILVVCCYKVRWMLPMVPDSASNDYMGFLRASSDSVAHVQ